MHESLKHETTFGYLSAIYSPDYGYFGGYLVVSTQGRPLEFHCTAPVLPSRAQQILYGPTLEPFLVGEQIGGSLIAAAKLVPRLILTDLPDFEVVQRHIVVPLILVRTAKSGQPTATMNSGQHSAQTTASSLGRSEKGEALLAWGAPCIACSHVLQFSNSMEFQREAATELLAVLAESVELMEPFGRIHDAIREAQRIGGRGQEGYAQSA
jgi:hypothetical protein